MLELAEFFLALHKENPTDYLAKYKSAAAGESNAQEVVATKRMPRVLPKPTHENPTADSTANAPVCPKCNSSMLLRTATKGERIGKKFWGCSNYPKCRNIVNVEEKL